MMRSFPALVLAAMLATGCGDDYEEPAGLCVLPVGESPARGAGDAWVTIVEFSDFQCPYCAIGASMVDAFLAEYAGDLRVVFKHLPYHDASLVVAVAAECAKEQEKFWELHDLLFTYQNDVSEPALQSYASAVGLEMTAWNACRDDLEIEARIAADERLAYDAYVSGTPTFFVNGSRVLGANSTELRVTIDEELARALASGTPRASYYESLLAKGCELDVP